MTSTVNGIMDSNGPMPETIEKEDQLKVSCEIIKADFQSSHESLFPNKTVLIQDYSLTSCVLEQVYKKSGCTLDWFPEVKSFHSI